MSAIVLDRAHQALALGEVKKPADKVGDLQGHKIIPVSFYLHVAGAIIGGVAAVALTVAAIAFSIFTLYIAVAACALLCLSNALGAASIYRLAPPKELDSIIDNLSKKIHNLIKANQDSKKNVQEIVKVDITHKKVDQPMVNVNIVKAQVETETEEEFEEEEEVLQNQTEEGQEQNVDTDLENEIQSPKLLKFTVAINDFAKQHKNDMIATLDGLTPLFVEGEEIAIIQQMKEAVEKMNLDEQINEPGVFFEKLLVTNRKLCDQFSNIVRKLIKDKNDALILYAQQETTLKQIIDLGTSSPTFNQSETSNFERIQ